MSIQSTECKLRSLLERIYSSSALYEIEFIIDEYQKSIDIDFHLFMYIRERPWFSRNDHSQPGTYLKFNYIAFDFNSGSITRFETRDELEAHEKNLENLYVDQSDQRCAIFSRYFSDASYQRIINLTKRIFMAFYLNCGSQEHFIKNVSRRFTKTFFSENMDISNHEIEEFLNNRLDVSIAIVDQKDEMYFHKDAPLESLIRNDGAYKLPTTLRNSERFASDFRRSVTRKNQTHGVNETQDYHYVINTFTEEYLFFSDMQNSIRSKSKQKYCAIYFRKGRNIENDEVYIANSLIHTAKELGETREHDDLFLEIHRDMIVWEDELSERPIKSYGELDDYIAVRMINILDRAMKVGLCDGAACFKESFANNRCQLRMIHKLSDHKTSQPNLAPPANSEVESSLINQALTENVVLDVWHPIKTKYEMAKSEEQGNASKAAEYERWHLQAKSHNEEFNIGERASLIVPVWSGRVPVGAIEFFSFEEARMSPDMAQLILIAQAIGDLDKRLRLANDRGWLARMSYVHALRHQIERFRRRLIEYDEGIASEFVGFLGSAMAVDTLEHTERDLSAAEIKEALFETLSRNTDAVFATETLSRLSIELSGVSMASHACGAILSILDLIYSNQSHAPIVPSDIRFRKNPHTEGKRFIDIVYIPQQGTNLPLEDAAKLCVSPLKDHATPTYHYGLFLCAAQTRMLGGHAEFHLDLKTASRTTQFGVCFRVGL